MVVPKLICKVSDPFICFQFVRISFWIITGSPEDLAKVQSDGTAQKKHDLQLGFGFGIGLPANFVEYAASYFQGNNVSLDLDFGAFRKFNAFNE